MSTLALDPRRVRGLTVANTRLMTRNLVTLLYTVALPLLPLAALVISGGGGPEATVPIVSTVLLLAMLFPVYYATLSQVVTRRDELVLKRLRTGEASDADILLSIALPGAGIGVLVSLLALPLASLVGLDAPTAPLLYVVMVVGSAVMFSALAFWTAAWTRTAEAAQLTSAPVLVLASVGPFIDLFPSEVARWLALTPGGILDDLAGRTWSGDGFVETWTASGESLLALLGWTVLAVWLAARTMRWEPRA